MVFSSTHTTEFHRIINNTPDNALPPPEEFPHPNDSGERFTCGALLRAS